jgi:DNA-binding response OmpR family regulator
VLAQSIVEEFRPGGYAVRIVRGNDGSSFAEMAHQVDLVLLDLPTTVVDGLVLLVDLKASIGAPPVILLGGERRRSDVIVGLSLGADDVLSRPIDVAELRARTDIALRRREQLGEGRDGSTAPQRIEFQGLIIDHGASRATLDDVDIPLTPTEYRILATIASGPEYVVSRAELSRVIWGTARLSDSRAIDVHVSRIRRKIRAIRSSGPSIIATRLQAYRLAVLTAPNPRTEPPG